MFDNHACPRSNSKTKVLIALAGKRNATIVTKTKEQALHIKNMAKDLDVKIKDPICMQNYAQNRLLEKRKETIILDDFDLIESMPRLLDYEDDIFNQITKAFFRNGVR